MEGPGAQRGRTGGAARRPRGPEYRSRRARQGPASVASEQRRSRCLEPKIILARICCVTNVTELFFGRS